MSCGLTEVGVALDVTWFGACGSHCSFFCLVGLINYKVERKGLGKRIWSVLKVKHLHGLVFGGRDQNVVAVLHHRPHEVLVLCLQREEVVHRGHSLLCVRFLFLARAARIAIFAVFIIIGF